MSHEDAQSFLERLRRDPGLRQATMKAAEAQDAERLVTLAAEQKLSFTASELAAATSRPIPESGNVELDDAELEGFAGGLDFNAYAQMLQKLNQMTTAISNVLNTMHDQAKGVAKNIRG